MRGGPLSLPERAFPGRSAPGQEAQDLVEQVRDLQARAEEEARWARWLGGVAVGELERAWERVPATSAPGVGRQLVARALEHWTRGQRSEAARLAALACGLGALAGWPVTRSLPADGEVLALALILAESEAPGRLAPVLLRRVTRALEAGLGDSWERAWAYRLVGEAWGKHGDLQTGRRYLRRALGAFGRIGEWGRAREAREHLGCWEEERP